MTTATHSPSHVAARPPAKRFAVRADLRCTLCAQQVGVLANTPERGFVPVAWLVPADGSASRVVDWTRMRCTRCGSTGLFVDNPETIVVRVSSNDSD